MAKTKKKKSQAEIQREYRARLKEKNPEQTLLKERLRWHKRRELKKIKLIDDMTEREQRQKRKEWRTRKAEYRKTKRILTSAVNSETPPGSDEGTPMYAERVKRGRKKVARSRTRSNRLVVKLSEKLNGLRRQKERFKKRLYRLQQQRGMPQSVGLFSTVTDTPSHLLTPRTKTCALLRSIPKATSHVRKTLLYHHVLAEDAMHTVHNKTAKAARMNLLKKYRLVDFARKSGAALPQRIMPQEKDKHGQYQHGNAVDSQTRDLVRQFYERDDNSRITTGKKQTATKRKEKRQVRLLLDTMTNLHEKFCSEYNQNIISYVMFTRLRPFFVRTPTAKDRDTCLCKKHENVQLMADKLYQLRLIKVRNCEDVIKDVCCDITEKRCMFRECAECCDSNIQFETSGVPDDQSKVFWSEWKSSMKEYEKQGEKKTTKLTTKCVKHGSLKDLKEQFSDSIKNVLCRHVYIIRHQFRMYRSLKDNLQPNEAVIHIDFSENYTLKYANEIQEIHFGVSNRQATIHTGVLYTNNSMKSFATISDSYRHDPVAVWSHMKPVLQNLCESNTEITYLHFFSDGPTTQYRNKMNFYLFSKLIFKYGFGAGTWNFFESGHGKGAPDAIGGAVKRHADTLVNTGHDIASARELYDTLAREESRISLFYVDSINIQEMDNESQQSLTAIMGTMKLHQLCSDSEYCIAHRNLSCFCSQPTICSCYEIQRNKFPVVLFNEASTTESHLNDVTQCSSQQQLPPTEQPWSPPQTSGVSVNPQQKTKCRRRKVKRKKTKDSVVDVVPCAVCGVRWCDDTSGHSWVQCQACCKWYHNECQGLDDNDAQRNFFCVECEDC